MRAKLSVYICIAIAAVVSLLLFMQDYLYAATNLTISTTVHNIPDGSQNLVGLWKVNLMDSSGQQLAYKVSSNPNNISFTGISSGTYELQYLFQANDDLGIVEFWGDADVTVTSSNVFVDFVREMPWGMQIIFGSTQIDPGDDLPVTVKIKNQMAGWVRAKVEGSINDGTWYESPEALIPPSAEQNFNLTIKQVSYSHKPYFKYIIYGKDSANFDIPLEVTDHYRYEKCIVINEPKITGSQLALFNFRDREGSIWVAGADYNNIQADWTSPSELYKNVKIYKNGIQTKPTLDVANNIMGTIARYYEQFRPQFTFATQYNSNYGMWCHECALREWACKTALVDFDDNERFNIYKDIIWDALVSERHPYLFGEIKAPKSSISPGGYVSALIPDLSTKVDNILQIYDTGFNHTYRTLDAISKIMHCADLYHVNPEVTHLIDSSPVLKYAMDAVGLGNLSLNIALDAFQYTAMMEFLVTTGIGFERLNTFRTAYSYVKSNVADIDPILESALDAVENELKAAASTCNGIIYDSILKATKEQLADSEFLKSKIMQLIQYGGRLGLLIARSITHKFIIDRFAFASIIQQAIDAYIFITNPGDEWRKMHIMTQLSEVLTYYFVHSQDFHAVETTVPEMTVDKLLNTTPRDVYDLMSFLNFEKISLSIGMIDPDYYSVVSSALKSTVYSLQYSGHINPLFYCSTALILGGELGKATINLWYDDEMNMLREDLECITNACVKRNQIVSEWGTMIQKYVEPSPSLASIPLLLMDVPTPPVASSFTLPDTGITQCYNNTGVIPCPSPGEAFYGQDAQYNPAATQPSYTNNGDGTVTDNVTGLMWMQADDGGTRTWQSAITYCDGLSHAGHSDWRLPDRPELLSIVDFSRRPAINPVFSSHINDYWSNSPDAGYSDYAWYVHFNSGYTDSSNKYTSNYVRCVRFGP